MGRGSCIADTRCRASQPSASTPNKVLAADCQGLDMTSLLPDKMRIRQMPLIEAHPEGRAAADILVRPVFAERLRAFRAFLPFPLGGRRDAGMSGLSRAFFKSRKGWADEVVWRHPCCLR